jgi:glycosyltransferase involved in cell wall biosynthesis
VATAVGGTPEVLGSTGTAGCLVPSRDPVGLAAAVVALARDPERRASLAAAARRRVESAFTVDRMVTDYTRVYRGLLG